MSYLSNTAMEEFKQLVPSEGGEVVERRGQFQMWRALVLIRELLYEWLRRVVHRQAQKRLLDSLSTTVEKSNQQL